MTLHEFNLYTSILLVLPAICLLAFALTDVPRLVERYKEEKDEKHTT